jgi:hypothetical protein
MSVEHVEVLVEEPSIEVALRLLLPKMLGEISFEIYPFLCKDDLLDQLPKRLLGYAAWLPENYRIVVIVDRDDDDCAKLKSKLEGFAKPAGLKTRSQANEGSYRVINRIVIEELEAWYFGDWTAVQSAYPKVSKTIPSQARYRAADSIKGGTWEAFQRVLQQSGYFEGGLRKLEAARSIAEHMEPARNSSPSFRALRDALARIASEP